MVVVKLGYCTKMITTMTMFARGCVICSWSNLLHHVLFRRVLEFHEQYCISFFFCFKFLPRSLLHFLHRHADDKDQGRLDYPASLNVRNLKHSSEQGSSEQSRSAGSTAGCITA
jgi:hypothetical protein